MKRSWRRYWKHTAVVAVLFSVFFVARTGQITRGPDRVSKQPVQVRIDDPLVLIRGKRCLLTETKIACSKRVP